MLNANISTKYTSRKMSKKPPFVSRNQNLSTLVYCTPKWTGRKRHRMIFLGHRRSSLLSISIAGDETDRTRMQLVVSVYNGITTSSCASHTIKLTISEIILVD